MKTQTKNKSGFTLIELLVVIAVISMLISLLVVGMAKTRIISMNLRQKSVFHAMEIGLELFSKDFDGYPESKVLPDQNSANQICGAQHLLEALIGRDEKGVEPKTNWYAPDATLYEPPAPNNPLTQTGYGYYDSTNQKSMGRRKGPYTELKQIGIWTVHELWQGNNGTSNIYDSQAAGVNYAKRAPVFTDTFQKFKVALSSGETIRVGMPILYFKANRAAPQQFRLDRTAQNEVVNPVDADMPRWTYNYLDNRAVVRLPSLDDMSLAAEHYVNPNDASKTKPQVFYEQITQRSEPGRPYFKPFNADTYLLISAGWDGLYGTKDDITNMEY